MDANPGVGIFRCAVVALSATVITRVPFVRVEAVRLTAAGSGATFGERSIDTRSSNERAIGDVLPSGGVDGSRVIALARSRGVIPLVPAALAGSDSRDDGKFSLDEDDAGGHLSRTDFFRPREEDTVDPGS